MKEKVILAYSGGLDTTAIIPWLKENYDYEVICCCIDCGQEEELDGLEERAISCGASKLYIVDIIDEFCDDYIMPCVQANAIYENKYLLGTSMARPLIGKKLVEIARKEGATAICHGATGGRNTFLEGHGHILALLRSFFRGDAEYQQVIVVRLTGRILELKTLVADMPDVAVTAVAGVCGERKMNAVSPLSATQ